MTSNMDMPEGFLQTFPNWILPSLRPAQGLAYLSPVKVSESLSTHYKNGANYHGPGIIIFDGMGLSEKYRNSQGIPFFHKQKIFEEIEELEPIIIQGVHRTATAIEEGENKSYFVLSSQPHIDYLLKIVQEKISIPEGWDYSIDTLRIIPKNYRTISTFPFYDALNFMEEEYKNHLQGKNEFEGWTMDDFVEELCDRFG